jgi:RNA polymerase sigma factor (sigma-70 family)
VTQCIARYGSLVWSIARRSGASAETEPLTRDVFAQLWQQAARHDSSNGSEPLFIAVTARRVLLDRLRASEPRPSLQPESLGGAEPSTPIERCPEATLAAGVLATLDPGQRRILSLAVGQGMTYLEIGKITASSPDAAKSLVRRALVAVRKRLNTGAGADPHKRLHTLLTDRAIAGLDAKDRVEFEHLRAGAAIDPSYEAAAAAIDLALLVQLEPLPEPVKTALGEQAAQHFGFAIKKPRDASSRQRKAASVGAARASEPTPGDDVEGDFGEDDFGDDELLLGEGEPEAAPVRRTWEQSPRSGSIDDSLESGVLESSLTDGKVDRTATPSDSQRAEIVAKLEPRSKSGPRPNRRRTDRQPSGPVQVLPPEPEPEPPEPVVAKPKAKLKPKSKSKPEPEPSESEQGSTVVRMPVRESSLARVATYVSALAAVSMLAVAVWQYMHRDDPPDVEDVQAQLESAQDSLEWTFQVEQDEAVGEGAAGRVLWSPELQKGVVIVTGLAANDASASQYQLWIRDAQREGTPVPGPVFDVEGADEVSVAFEAVLVIGEPTAFLITVERPGGVVVSKQDRVLMIATGS